MTRKRTKLQLALETEQQLRTKILFLDREIAAVIGEKIQLEQDANQRLAELSQAKWSISFLEDRVKQYKLALAEEKERTLWSHLKECFGF